jgi:fumarate reductase flavoprotein subunit
MHMMYNHWAVNARLVRAVINKSGDTIRWLEDQGVNFYLPRMSPGETFREWHNPKKGGPEVIQAFLNTCQNLGVQILYKTRVNKILTDSSGIVNGVAAKAKGTNLTVKAKSVIIATGGFGGNKRMMRKYTPFLDIDIVMKRTPILGIHNGDGIRMAFESGAASDSMGNLCLHGPLPEARRAFGIAIEAKTVWVNRSGERFMEESASFNPFESGNGVLRQPGQMCFSLFDEGILQNAIKNGMDRPFESSLHSRPQNYPKLDSILKEELRGHLKYQIVDEIAKWMGELCNFESHHPGI